MAERGRRPKGNYKEKTEVFSSRIRADTKAALVAAAARRGHSASQEWEYRIRRSFDEDQGIMEKLGGRENYAVLRIISSLMGVLSNPTGPRGSWLHDPYLFDQLVKAVAVVLNELRPPGDAALPPSASGPWSEAIDALYAFQSKLRAAEILIAVKEAQPDLPLATDNPAPFIRADLGPVAERIGTRDAPRLAPEMIEKNKRALDEILRELDQGRKSS
jgi:hypothetical protein